MRKSNSEGSVPSPLPIWMSLPWERVLNILKQGLESQNDLMRRRLVCHDVHNVVWVNEARHRWIRVFHWLPHGSWPREIHWLHLDIPLFLLGSSVVSLDEREVVRFASVRRLRLSVDHLGKWMRSLDKKEVVLNTLIVDPGETVRTIPRDAIDFLPHAHNLVCQGVSRTFPPKMMPSIETLFFPVWGQASKRFKRVYIDYSLLHSSWLDIYALVPGPVPRDDEITRVSSYRNIILFLAENREVYIRTEAAKDCWYHLESAKRVVRHFDDPATSEEEEEEEEEEGGARDVSPSSSLLPFSSLIEDDIT